MFLVGRATVKNRFVAPVLSVKGFAVVVKTLLVRPLTSAEVVGAVAPVP